MFCKNNAQQTTFLDPVAPMPKYLQDILKKGWAQAFRYYVFLQINEERFSVIYSIELLLSGVSVLSASHTVGFNYYSSFM